MPVYFNGRFVAPEAVHISPDDRGFLLADGVYEVIRAYTGRFFRLEEHLARLERNLAALRITGVDVPALGMVAAELLRRNALERGDAALYVQITRGAAPRAHAFPEPPPAPTVYVTARPLAPTRERWERSVAVITVPDLRWGRCDLKTIALLPNVLASQQAREAGAEEALFVRAGVLTEGAHTNVFAVRAGALLTHPLTPAILPGITRRVVLELCADLGLPCREEPLPVAALPEIGELFLTGTTSEIIPVVQCDGRPVGEGRPGPVTQQLQQAFRGKT